MANPRVFLSSTCYDLQEVRNNLRNFIKEFEYEAVGSDFGDIFYEFDTHVQDSCVKEIEKCQLYILIIGNNYGSIYYKNQATKENPDSVTLQEFKKSIAINIPKHIFINKYVHYDYQNYRKALDNKFRGFFEINDILDEDVTTNKQRIRKEFDNTYPFPQVSYKYIFRFIDVIYDLQTNNAIFPFETSEDIKFTLKKQWAGYMYEKLTTSKLEKIEEAQKERLGDISGRLINIEKILESLLPKGQDNHNKLSFDLDTYIKNFAYENFEKVKKILNDSLEKIMVTEDLFHRCSIQEELTYENILIWLKSLDNLIKKYKWSNTIPINEIFSQFSIKTNSYQIDVVYDDILKLNGLFLGMLDDEIEPFVNSVKLYLEKFVEVKNEIWADEEIPF